MRNGLKAGCAPFLMGMGSLRLTNCGMRTSLPRHSGGATVEDVKLFRQHISPDLRIKAAGGIRSFEQAQAMLDAGADRIGASALAALMEE